MEVTLDTVLVSIERLVNTGVFAPSLLARDFDSVEVEILGRPALQSGFENIEATLGR
jgi:hypothetical protein